jgi:cytochrome P450 family 6/cytochrome P450 family 28
LQIKTLFPLVDEVLNRFTKHISDELDKNHKQPFDTKEICTKFTTDVVSSCIFDADAQSFTKDKPEIREMGRKIMQFSPWITFWFIMYSIFPILMKVYKVKMVQEEVEEFFTGLMRQAVEQREKHPVSRDDYLAYLISLRNKKQFSELDMAAHGVTFFIGESLNCTFR